MSPEEEGRIRRLARAAVAVLAVRRLSRAGTTAPAADPTAPEQPPESIASPIDPSERIVPANPRAEAAVVALLVLAAVFGFGFTAVYVVLSHNTQLLGLAIGGMLACLAAAAIMAGKLVVVQETSVEERDALLEPESVEEIAEMVESGGDGISRRVLLAGAGGLAGAAALTAAATPLASFGPRLAGIHATPWRRGVRFVDEHGHPLLADDIQVGSFYTALPEGADWEQLGAGLLVVKLPAKYIHLPEARKTWAPEGILAYSKICPHAACAISLFRYPTFAPTSVSEPAFTCPCHYSTFLPGEGGRLIFGPAGRALPQLPVMVDSSGYLRAAGEFDEDVGPSWVNVRRRPATP